LEGKTINILLYLPLLFIIFLLFLGGIHIANSIRIKNYFAKTLYAPLPDVTPLESFTIAHPYQGPGKFYKAQLHLHTSNSKDVSLKLPVSHTIGKYKEAGYSFVVITDHDQITTFPELNSSDFVCIPGVEVTIPFIFWPLGKHLVVINPGIYSSQKATYKKLLRHQSPDRLMAPAHPNWVGNLGTGFWFAAGIQSGGFHLIEIHNHHSETGHDLRLWHKLLTLGGYQHPIWGVAVDDTDNAEPLDRGWIMVKTNSIDTESFITALRNGNFYATTGPMADFQVIDGTIHVQTPTPCQIKFLDARYKIVASFTSSAGTYRPQGHEGFIRIEIQGENAGFAWSQPFFLVPNQ
jgi:hypothetical protein